MTPWDGEGPDADPWATPPDTFTASDYGDRDAAFSAARDAAAMYAADAIIGASWCIAPYGADGWRIVDGDGRRYAVLTAWGGRRMSRDNDDGARMIADRARELFGVATADDAGALVAAAHAAGGFGSTFCSAPFASLRRGWLAFYVESQQYGGPEEGGWHFTAGELVAAVPCARWSAAGERASTAAETAADGYGGPRFHAEPLANGDPVFWLDPPSHAAAVATLAAAVAHIGPPRARYGLAVHWSDTFPETYYPAERPRYE